MSPFGKEDRRRHARYHLPRPPLGEVGPDGSTVARAFARQGKRPGGAGAAFGAGAGNPLRREAGAEPCVPAAHSETERRRRKRHPAPGERASSANASREVSRERFDAVLFDLDGVVTSTAAVHMAAWKRVFDAFLEGVAPGRGVDRRPFEQRDYRLYVDGRPRYDGVRGFLASRAVTLAEGRPDDPPGRETVCGLGNRKNEVFRAELGASGVTAFPSTVSWIRALRRQGFKTAIVTASRNGATVLAATGVADQFDAVLDGIEAARMGLAGKPAPDTYVAAARMLGVETRRAVVVEDAVAEIRAGRDGGFGLVIGLAGPDDADEMLDNGADDVVADLGEMAG